MTTTQADALPEPVGFRHSLTHTLHETEAEVQLADAESEAEPLYTADQMRAYALAALQSPPAGSASLLDSCKSVIDGIAVSSAVLKQSQPAAETALQKFVRLNVADEVRSPLEQLRSFCSFAMSGQDWIDCEPFFDAIVESEQPAAAGVSDADLLVVAEFVGLIGPGSRVGESHDAAVRFARAILALRPQSEPVGEAGTMPGTSGFTMACFHADKVPVGTKLYAEALRPQAVPMTPEPVQRLPMTNEQAKQLLKRSDLLDMFLHIGWYSAPRKGFDQHALSLIRAIEAHHGITAQGAQGGEG